MTPSPQPPTFGAVLRVEAVSSELLRVVLGGPGLDEMAGPAWTDAYVNLLFVPPGAAYDVPFDLETARSGERHLWPVPRRFTVRAWDAERRELTIDFVIHGDAGTAGRWAQGAQPGDRLQFGGPSGGYRPDPDVTWHLMVGDESALPAIAVSLEALPATARALCVAIVEGPDGEIPLTSPAPLDVTWLHRSALDGPSDSALAGAVAALDFPADDVHGFVHGEAGETRAVRRHLLGERAMPRERLSVSPYWRRTFTDERWREVKRDWLREVEADV